MNQQPPFDKPAKIVYELDPDALASIVREEVRRGIAEALTAKDPYSEYPNYLTRKQAAAMLGVSLSTVNRLILEDQIKPVKITGHRQPKILKQEIVALSKDFVTEL
ncbi:MAG: helix-turn-helix domain-containing protein [Haliscomenobacter sp.]|nr:helix-turn-helix domain-containing protein [Haliscomenobacter sp.]